MNGCYQCIKFGQLEELIEEACEREAMLHGNLDIVMVFVV